MYSTSLVSLICLAAAALPVACAAEHHHNLHKRALVTDYVYVTHYVYENAHVWVDNAGTPYSTSFEIVSADVEVTSAAPVSTQAPVTTSLAVVASANNLAAQPSSSQAAVETSVAPVETSVAPVETSVAPVVSSAAPVETSSAAPAATSSSSSSSSSSGGDFSGDATYYAPGLGACGWTSSDSDLIAALNAPQFHSFGSMSNGNPACGKSATVSRGGKSVTVKIVDLCPECKYGSLDLSPAAFDQLADESEGRVEITWSWN